MSNKAIFILLVILIASMIFFQATVINTIFLIGGSLCF